MNHKTILFVAALPAELKSIKKEVKKLTLVGIRVKFFLSGVGNYKTIYNLKHHLDSLEERPDFLVNIGLCGKTGLSPSETFQVYRILSAANERELLCPIYINHLKKQSILSSEKVITNEAGMQGEQYVDMESYAIDTVATEEKIPYLILKKPFDIVSEESRKIDIKKFEDCLSDIGYESLIINIQKFLVKNHDEAEILRQEYLSKTLAIYSFTFSEKEIWKKGYAKFVSFGGDYSNFLDKNSKLNKKEYLKQLGI